MLDINSLESTSQNSSNQGGMYGDAVRQATSNPAQGIQRPNPTQVQVGNIQTPGNIDLSSVRESQAVVNKLLGNASDVFNQYVQSKTSEWELDGRMAFAQGKTEDEIRQSGNAYTLAGYQATKVQSAADQFYQNEMNFITNGGGAQLPPDQYRARLNQAFASLNQNVNPQDTFTKGLLDQQAKELFPRLVEQHTGANNTWLHVNTMNETQNNLAQLSSQTGITPEEVKARTEALLTNIPNPEDRKAIISGALHDSLSQGNDTFAKAVLGSPTGTPKDMANKNAVGIIMNNEIRGGVIQDVSDSNLPMGAPNARAIGGINSAAFPKEYGEVKAALAQGQDKAREYLQNFYQKNIVEKYKLDQYNPQVEAVLADAYTNSPTQGKAIQALADKGMTADQLLDARRDMYSEAAKDAAPNSPAARNLAGWLNRVEQTRSAIDNPNVQMQGGYQYQMTHQYQVAARSLGLTPAMVQQIGSDVSSFYQDQNVKFANDRALTESGIDNAIQTGATLPKIQGMIDANRQKFGNDWANSKQEQATSQIASRDQSQFMLNNALQAAHNNQLGNPAFSDEIRQQVLTRNRLDVMSQVMADQSIPPAQKNQEILARTLKLANDNVITDPAIKAGLHAGFSQNILNGDKTLNQNVLGAYKDALYIEKNSPPGTIANYLTEEEQARFNAIKNRDGFEGANAASAIQAVGQLDQEKKNGTFVAPKLPAAFSDNIGGLIYKQINPGWLGFIDSTQALSKWGTYANNMDMHQIANSPQFKAVAQSMYTLAAEDNPHMSENDLMTTAASWAVNRAEPMPGGNLVFGSNKGTIRAAMGFGNDLTNNLPAEAVAIYLKNNGMALYGPRYAGISNNPEAQLKTYYATQAKKDVDTYNSANGTNLTPQEAIQKGIIQDPAKKPHDITTFAKAEDLIDGIPPINISYDNGTDSFIFDPEIKQNGTFVASHTPIVIPAKEIGDSYKTAMGYNPGSAQPYRSFGNRVQGAIQFIHESMRESTNDTELFGKK